MLTLLSGSYHLQVDVGRCDDNLDIGRHLSIVQLTDQLLDLRCGFVALPVAADKEASLAHHGCNLPCAGPTNTIQGVADLYHKSEVQLLQHAADPGSGSSSDSNGVMITMRLRQAGYKMIV